MSERKLDDVFAAMSETPGRVDCSNIFPGPGTYAVQCTELKGGDSGVTENPKPFVRAVLSIVKVQGQEKSRLVGKTFSHFFSLVKSKSKDALAAPAAYTARSLYRIHLEEFPPFGYMADDALIQQWIRDLDGKKFIVERSLREDEQGRTQPRDVLMSIEEWKKRTATATELAGPENQDENVAAAAATS